MLTTHLLSTHALAMDCVRSASVGVADDRVRLAYMAQAGRLLSLYARSVDRLERRREWSEWRARAARERAQEAALARALSDQFGPLPPGGDTTGALPPLAPSPATATPAGTASAAPSTRRGGGR